MRAARRRTWPPVLPAGPVTEQLRDRACIVGVGESRFGKRGSLTDVGSLRLALDAIHAAAADAGIDVGDIDGFSSFHDDGTPPSDLTMALPTKEWSYSAMTWGGGGSGLATAVLNAVMAVVTGRAHHVVVVRSIVQGRVRLGGSWVDNVDPDSLPRSFQYTVPFGFAIAPALYAMRARRHMAEFGTTPDHFAAVAIEARRNAARNPRAIFREPLTIEQHHASRIIADPLRLFDCCMESDGAGAFIVTTADRSKDLRQPPVAIAAISTAVQPGWVTPVSYVEPDDVLASAGLRRAADELYRTAGIGPADVDVALIYDGTTAGVLLALEDWGFCKRGDGGPFVADGEISIEKGSVPVNPHGGSLAEAYLQGLNHMVEGVRQLRGTSTNQVAGAEVALYTSSVGYPPGGGVLLRRAS